MIKARTRDDPDTKGIILELSGHADPVEGEPPGLGSRVCAGVSCFFFALSAFVVQNETPDPPGSGFLHLCLPPEHYDLYPFILHFLQQMQDTYPAYVELKLEHKRETHLPLLQRIYYCIKRWRQDG